MQDLLRATKRLTNKTPFPDLSLCGILRSKAEVEECTHILGSRGFFSHDLKCKDWDLAHIIPCIGDGNFLDMGSSDSYILKNVSAKRIRGDLHGIDLREPDARLKHVKYHVGDLINTGLPDNHFTNITCLSVIEHDVDFERFARESSRLLLYGGKLFVTFDYWNPKIVTPRTLYGLKWQILDRHDVEDLIAKCGRYDLRPVQEMDWTAGEAVIRDGYYSPHPDVSYTFGIVTFEKRISSKPGF